MARLTDPQRRAKFLHVLSLWDCTYYINWTEPAARFIYRELGLSLREMGKIMFEYVRDGGDIHEIRETREGWLEWPFHYDLYPLVGTRKVYLETRFIEENDPDDCSIKVVSAHDP